MASPGTLFGLTLISALTHSLRSSPAGPRVPGPLHVFLTLLASSLAWNVYNLSPSLLVGMKLTLIFFFFLVVWNSVLKTHIQAVSHKTYFL